MRPRPKRRLAEWHTDEEPQLTCTRTHTHKTSRTWTKATVHRQAKHEFVDKSTTFLHKLPLSSKETRRSREKKILSAIGPPGRLFLAT